ncbi:hypothetical protein NL487_30525, partial [Klebsiella pneumoniae]|nr:hypothetical protein [Klebsiella pneumoniae]
TGTRVRYWADPQIFLDSAEFSYGELVSRVRQTAFLIPGLAITVVDGRDGEPTSETFRFDGGTVDFVDFLARDAPVT